MDNSVKIRATKEPVTFLLSKSNVQHKWFELTEALILNIYDKTIDGHLFSMVLSAMSGDFMAIERTTEFIQIKKYL